MYDNELSHARRVFDKTAKDKAKSEIEAERHGTNDREVQSKATKKAAEADRLERTVGALVAQLADSKKKAEDAAAEKNKLIEELKTTKSDYNKMQIKLTDAKKNMGG
jgi:chromosome segregation ATPase